MNSETNRLCRAGRRMRLGVSLSLAIMIPGVAALAQKTFSVRLNNWSHQTVYVVVYDHTCQSRVFEGNIGDQAMKPISVCRGARGKGTVTVYDRRGRKTTYRNLESGASIRIRFR